MNLVFIYGPPASGKLTIAEELAEQTGYKLFHNHLTQDLAKEIYPDFDGKRFQLVDKLRLDIFEYAAINNTNIIFTFVYSGDKGDDKFIDNAVSIVANSGGEVLFVELTAPKDVLLDRVTNESRKKFHKLTDISVLTDQLEKGHYSTSIPSADVYKVDTSAYEPFDIAKSIVGHFNL